MHFELLQVYTPSVYRRYVPKHDEFVCPVIKRLHNNIRGMFRALSSYSTPDREKGAKYMPLSRIADWLERNTHHVAAMKEFGFHHMDGTYCAECRAAIETGFHSRCLAVAADALAQEQQKVEAEITAPAPGPLTVDYIAGVTK